MARESRNECNKTKFKKDDDDPYLSIGESESSESYALNNNFSVINLKEDEIEEHPRCESNQLKLR